MIRLFLFFLLLSLPSLLYSQSFSATSIPRDWLTVPEKTDYLKTSTHAEVMSMLESLVSSDERVHLFELGKSPEGKTIPLIVINGTDIPVPNLPQADLPTIYLQGNIHAGEVEGKEALLILLREFALGMHQEWVNNRVVLINPIYNTDSNDAMEAGVRPSQEDSPLMVGQRPNSQGFDLNRDGVKMEADETKAIYKMLNRWDPDLFVDFHTTNGTWHGYRLTWAPAYQTAGDSSLFNYSWYEMLPSITDAVQRKYGLHFGPYGWYNLRNGWPPKSIQTYNHHPRYLVNMMGLRNRMGILSETFAHDRFYHRIHAAYAFGKEILDYFAQHGEHIQKLNYKADQKAKKAMGTERGVRFKKAALPETFTLRTYDYLKVEMEEGSPQYYRSGEIVSYEGIQNYSAFEPTTKAILPKAYYLSRDLQQVAEHLQKHGVRVEKINKDTVVTASTYRVSSWTKSKRSFQKHNRIEGIEGDWNTPAKHRLEKGGWVVPMNQSLAYVALYLLEPNSDDGLVSWNFFDEWLIEDEALPLFKE